MKLQKSKAMRGWYISCQLGKNIYTSWWTSPPESVDHVDIGYLKDRYPCITTQKRVDKFKGLFKILIKDEGSKK